MNHIFSILKTLFGWHKEIMTTTTEDITVPTFACPEYKKLSEYGYIRTIADIIKVLNEQNHYTDSEVLINDLQKTLEPYRERGTVSQSAIDAVRCLIHDQSTFLFMNNELDVNEFARIIDQIHSAEKNPIDDVFSIREKAKILYAVELANKICKYTNPDDLVYDLQSLFCGETIRGWRVKLLDDVHPHMDGGVRYFLDNIKKAWSSISQKDNQLTEATLNNDLLESYMFTSHEKKIKDKGLVATLKKDYNEVSWCGSTRYIPKMPGGGPIYVIVRDNKQLKRACHPSFDTLIQQGFYERSLVSVLLKNMVKRNEYKQVEGCRDDFYIPVKDYTRPVYYMDGKKKEFDSEEEKLAFIKKHL